MNPFTVTCKVVIVTVTDSWPQLPAKLLVHGVHAHVEDVGRCSDGPAVVATDLYAAPSPHFFKYRGGPRTGHASWSRELPDLAAKGGLAGQGRPTSPVRSFRFTRRGDIEHITWANDKPSRVPLDVSGDC